MRQKLGEGSKPGYDARVAAGLGRGPNLRKKALAAAWSATWPAPGATLDLDFANDRGFVRGVGQGKSMDAVTFTRASSANWVDSAGVLRTGAGSFPGTANALGNNLLTFPQDFDNAAWTKNETSVIANCVIAPDGNSTADKLVENATTARHFIRQGGFNPVALTTYTLSVYAKAGERRYVQLSLNDNSTGKVGSFDLQTGTLGAVQDTGVTRTITDVGNGWYRCTVTYTMSSSPSTNQNNDIYVTATDVRVETYAGNGTSGIFIWGAQLEVASSATTYYPTNINVPRFDWASTAQVNRPNICLYTEDLGSNWWLKEANTTITTDQVTAPDGTNTADLVTVSANTANRFHSSTGTPTGPALTPIANATYTLSAYVKTGTATSVRASFPNTADGPFFDFATATWGTASGWTTSVQDVGSGWYRISATRTVSNSITRFGFTVFGSSYPANCYFWGLQVELGDTATPYIANGAYSATNTPLAANPTCNGLLIEESRANRLLWCRDATNAAWTKTNVTAAKDQTGIDGVANAASSLTASAGNGTCIQTITLASGSRTGSIYLKRITGSGNVQVTLDGSTWSTVDLSNGLWNRIVLSGTVTNPTVGIRLATNGDAVAMDYGQIEDGAFATSPILTTTASVTRSADAASMTGTNFSSWYRPDEGTIYCEAVQLRPNNDYAAIYTISRGTNADRIASYLGVDTHFFVSVNNVTLVNLDGGTTVFNVSAKFAGTYKINDFALSLNNGAASTDTSGTIPVVDRLFLGGSGAGSFAEGAKYIKKLAYYPKRLNDNVLSILTGQST